MLQPGRKRADFSRDARAIIALALAPAIGVGFARFAYSLLLPDMRMSLGWSYAAAGFMNTINAAGYLAGALVAAAVMRRLGRFNSIFYGTLACVLAMALSAVSANFVVLSVARLAAGIGAAVAFVGGGVVAAQLAERHPRRLGFLLSLYYIGPGLGIFLSGLGTPFLLEALGPGSWWIAWGALAAVAVLLNLLLLHIRGEGEDGGAATLHRTAPLTAMAAVLAGYLLFSIGSIAYMTFMIAWLRNGGAPAWGQSLFWSLLGFGGMCAPALWSWTLVWRGGRAVAAMTAVTFIATLTALMTAANSVRFLSAFVFGSAFFAVVAATTAFVRRNLPAAAWPGAVGAMTVAFGLGQIVGPLLSGAITDATGSLTFGLQVSALLLAAGALVAILQRDIVART